MGFRKLSETIDKYEDCLDPEHLPSGYIVLEPGTYEYTCPRCGKITIVTISKVY